MGEFKDPMVEPDGFEPPQSAEELLERYTEGERYFGSADPTALTSRAATAASTSGTRTYRTPSLWKSTLWKPVSLSLTSRAPPS